MYYLSHNYLIVLMCMNVHLHYWHLADTLIQDKVQSAYL